MASNDINFDSVSATILNGASITSSIDLGSNRACVVIIPSSWTAANLTFQVSNNGTDFYNLYDGIGVEYTIIAAASSAILLPIKDFACFRWIKIRSGTSGAAVNQAADRTLILLEREIL